MPPAARPHVVGLHGGVIRTQGKTPPQGALLRARNCRYVDEDRIRLHFLPGRSAFNALDPPSPSLTTLDINETKKIWAAVYDDGTRKLIWHKGGTLFEADLDAASEFTEGTTMAQQSSDVVPRGVAFSWQNRWHYLCGEDDWNDSRRMIVRDQAGSYRRGGFVIPTDPIALSSAGGGPLWDSTQDVNYTYRIYDSTYDIESAHGPIVTKTAQEGALGVKVEFPSGVTSGSDIGTHVRVYRTRLNETAGVYNRIDGAGDGIPIADVVPGYFIVDNVITNAQAIIYGRVRADGVEGEDSWGEHGGPVPPARGGLLFGNHLVVWGVDGFANRLIYSAQNYPEAFPVDLDGEYVYYIPFQTGEKDDVQLCLKTGEYLVVLLENSIWRISEMPTFENPGFAREIQAPVTEEDGVCGPWAAASFGIGPKQAQQIIYMSRDHGPVLTNGIYADPIAPGLDWPSLVDPLYFDNTEVIDYPRLREVWVFYTPKGATENTKAFIVDYSTVGQRKGTFRITWPIDVECVSALYAQGTDGIKRLYLADNNDRIYVQDSGQVDAQKNYNNDGDIQVAIETGRSRPTGQALAHMVHKGFIDGEAGEDKTVTITHYSLDGTDEYSVKDTAKVAADEGSDAFMVERSGDAFREKIEYTGPTGTSHDPDDATRAPAIRALEYEVEVLGPQPRTRGS